MKTLKSKIYIKGTVVAVFLVALVLVFTSCSKKTPDGQPAATNQKLTKVSLRLPWLFNAEAAGILVAKERGYFRDEGIDLTIQKGGVGLNPVQLVASGSDDIGIADGAAVIIGRSQGIPIKAIATEYQSSPLCYISLTNSGITAVKDFAGKRIGTQIFQVYVLEAMLAANGMKLSDVKVEPMQFDIRPLTDGQVDTFLSFVSDEPLLLKMKGIETHVIRASDNGYPFYGNVIFTTDKMLKDNPELLKHFLAAVFKGWREALQQTDAAATLVVEKYNPELDVKHQKLSLPIIADLVKGSVGPENLGTMREDVWTKSIQTLVDYKQITKVVPVQDVFTSRIVDDLYKK